MAGGRVVPGARRWFGDPPLVLVGGEGAAPVGTGWPLMASARRRAARRRGAEAPEDPGERRRRDVQRKCQQVALKAQKEGKKYRKPSWARGGSASTLSRSQRRRLVAPHVAVLPVLWQSRRHEAEDVRKACGRIADALKRAKLRVELDDDVATLPGRRMRKWEERGVKVRLEVGPRDVEANKATLACQGGDAGTVATKTDVGLAPGDLVPAVLEALQRLGVQLGDDYDAEAAATAARAEDEAAKAAAKASAPRVGGDDMDDFELS